MPEITPPADFSSQLADLRGAVEAGRAADTHGILDAADAETCAKLVDRLEPEERCALFSLLPAEFAAEILMVVHESEATNILEGMAPEDAAPVLACLDSDDRVDVLKSLDSPDAEALLSRLDAAVAAETRQLMAYPEGTAGAIMHKEFLAFQSSRKVGELLSDLQSNREKYAEYGVQYAYVLGANRVLEGVLPIRNFLFARPDQSAAEVMIANPLTVNAGTPLIELEKLFHEHSFLGLPVVDSKGRILGVVDRNSAQEAVQEAVTGDLLKLQGLMGKEELRSMPLAMRSRRRLAWLSINIVLNIIAASVIAFHQETLKAVIALAVFLPIISDMSGCSGNQAVAVSMRELALGLIRPREFLRVFLKESAVGAINGACLGLLIGLIAWLWKDNAALGLVVGSALCLNTIVAVCVGGTVPLLLKACKQDPALASGPILTTITDMCGFLLILSLASMLLPYLV